MYRLALYRLIFSVPGRETETGNTSWKFSLAATTIHCSKY